MYKHHLQGGVRKGALTQEEADKKFDAWLEEKNAKIRAKVDGLTKQADESRKLRLAAEKEVSDKRKAAALEVASDQTDETTPEATTIQATPTDAVIVADETPTESVTTETVEEDNTTSTEEVSQEEETRIAQDSEDEKSAEENPKETQENSEKESDNEE